MKLWGGRFTKEENQLVHNFNESLSFDQKFYHQDIQGSIAHVTMLAKQGIVSEEDRKAIIDGLTVSWQISSPASWYLPKSTRISIPSWRQT